MRKIDATFARFEELTTGESDPQLSNRIKLLIKNMLDNRASGWERTKKENEKKPMKVDDLRRETERKLREEQEKARQAEDEEQSYLGNSRSGGRGGRQGGYNQGGDRQYQEKGGRQDRGGRGGDRDSGRGRDGDRRGQDRYQQKNQTMTPVSSGTSNTSGRG